MKHNLIRCKKVKKDLKDYILNNFPGLYHSVLTLFDNINQRWILVVKFGLLGRDNKSIYIPLYFKGVYVDIIYG